MEQEDIKNASEIIKAGLPLFDRIIQSGKKAFHALKDNKSLPADEQDQFEKLGEELKELAKAQKKVASTVDSLLRYLRPASKLRTECDKSFELAFNSPPNPTHFFWHTQGQMVSNWEEWNSELVGAIERKRVPIISETMGKNLLENARNFRNSHTKIVSLLDSSDPDLGDYIIHVREAKRFSFNIEKELLIHVEDLIKGLGFGEI
jgi:hypothetical protein